MKIFLPGFISIIFSFVLCGYGGHSVVGVYARMAQYSGEHGMQYIELGPDGKASMKEYDTLSSGRYEVNDTSIILMLEHDRAHRYILHGDSAIVGPDIQWNHWYRWNAGTNRTEFETQSNRLFQAVKDFKRACSGQGIPDPEHKRVLNETIRTAGFSTLLGSKAENRDNVITDLAMLGADIYQFKIRPKSMGGGGGTYAGYEISPTGPWGDQNLNAFYKILVQTDNQVVILANSIMVEGATATISYDGEGRVISDWKTTGY